MTCFLTSFKSVRGAFFTWGLLFIVGLITLGASTAVEAAPVAESTYDQVREKQYESAVENLESQPTSPEALFLRGYIAFERKKFSNARTHFRTVVDRADTTHVRYKDALYYLDRLKLFQPPSPDPPRIRVRIGKYKSTLQFEEPDRMVLSRREGNNTIQPSTDWSATARNGRIVVESNGEQLLSGRSITVESDQPGRGILYDGTRYRGSFHLVFRNGSIDVINDLAINHYLYGVVKKELARGWPMATLKAQAVAARSFAIHRILKNQDEPFDLSATWISQVYGGKTAETPRINKAVDETMGQVLTFKGQVIPAYFHANSGGYIESPHNVWGGSERSFIKPKRDPWSLKTKHTRWEKALNISEMNEGLRQAGNPPIRSVRSSVSIGSKLPSGRAKTIQYHSPSGNVTLEANKFRVAVDPGELKSTWFDHIQTSGSRIRFEGRGWGHGVGMSQWGARAMAEEGKTYREILRFYYEPTQIAGQYGPTHLASSGTRVDD